MIAVSAIIWFAGPRFGLRDPLMRLYVILGVVALGIVILLIQILVTRLKGGRMKSDISDQKDPKEAEREAEIEALREKMDDAISQLKTSELGGGQRGAGALYALPWYMIIGPSAAGKSTLLCNSGLHFPYANSEELHLRGFGGTRNCDWWFSDQAVLLDTAGRYTTETDDREEWLTFLQMLRRHRKHMPLNGVIVALSVSDILTADAPTLENHVKIIRERIDELIRQLGVVFPVYLVFTKCDLIRGFESFFGDLSEDERQQVWGTYLLDAPDDDKPVSQRFDERMQALYERLSELRLRKLSMERHLGRKTELFDFPAQFRAASETLGEFVQMLFRRNPYQETPMLAGVYFTSSTQDGTPLQRALGGLREAFGLAPDGISAGEGTPRPFFIRRLFTDVIFQLPGIARGNRRKVLRSRWLKGVSVAASLAVMALGGIWLTGAYGINALLLSKGEERVAAVQEAVEGDALSPEAYSKLVDLRDYYQTVKRYDEGKPLATLFGVYTVDELRPEVEKALFRGLGIAFRDPSLERLESRLAQLGRRWQQADPTERQELRPRYYESLEAYLTTSRFQARLDEGNTSSRMADAWARGLGFVNEAASYSDIAEQRPALAELVDFYLARTDREPSQRQWAVRESLVERARDDLDTPPSADSLYARIRHNGEAQLEGRRLADLLNREGIDALRAEKTLQGFYTKAGWHGFMRGAIDDAIQDATEYDWVLDAPLAADAPTGTVSAGPGDGEANEELAKRLRAGIRTRYFDDYAAHWLGFLEGVRIKRLRSLDEAASTLKQVSGSDGPLGELTQVTAKHINLYEKEAPKNLPDGGDKAETARTNVPELQARLTDLRRFATPEDDKKISEAAQRYLGILGTLQKVAARMNVSANPARDAERYAARILGGKGGDTKLYSAWVETGSLLDAYGPQTRRALGSMLRQPIRDLWTRVVARARERVTSRWRAEVVSNFRRRLRDQFPFSADGADASLSTVSEFFRPEEGVIWSFVNNELDPYLERTGNGWRGASWLGVSPGFSREFFSTLDRARTITQALFAKSNRDPEFVFHLYPLPASGVSEIRLESNGQTYRYRNGPQQWRRLSWPGEMRRIGARVAGLISAGNVLAEREADGPWGLFHLLRQADIQSRGGDVYLVEWEIQVGSREPVPVRFKMRTDRQGELLEGSLWAGLAMPDAVFAGDAGLGNGLARGGR
jgi:type VI secretion system protein ImpL